MRGRLYELDSPDVPGMDLESYQPVDPTDVSIQVAARIGSDSEMGTNMFYFVLRTPRSLERELREKSLLFGRGYILVPEYDYRVIHEAISNLCASIEAPDWPAFAAKLRQYAFWEYD